MRIRAAFAKLKESSHPCYYRYHCLHLLNPHCFVLYPLPHSCPHCFLSSTSVSTARRKLDVIDCSQNCPPHLWGSSSPVSACVWQQACSRWLVSSSAPGKLTSPHGIRYLINNNMLPDDYCMASAVMNYSGGNNSHEQIQNQTKKQSVVLHLKINLGIESFIRG